MKTTIELLDDLLKQACAIVRTEDRSIRQIVGSTTAQRLKFPIYGGSGLTEGFTHSDWGSLHNEIYRQPIPGNGQLHQETLAR